MKYISRCFYASIAGLACLALAGSVVAQSYPSRPVRIIVPVAPGAGADIIARSIAPGMSQSLGQPIIIENKPGAAVTGERRIAVSPDVRTLAELGHPRIQGVGYSLNVRLGMPAVAFEKLHAAASRALQQPEVRVQLANIHVDIGGGSTEAASKRLADEAAIFSEIAKASNIQPE